MRIFRDSTTTEFPKILEEKSVSWLRSRRSSWVLVWISFAESIFLPIIIDPFLIALILANQNRWRWYIGISVTASIIGAVFAYILGALFFDTVGVRVLEFYALEDTFTNVAKQVDANGFVFVLLGAFTPIPYKIVALASGVLKINLFTFIIASIIGRVLRLGLVGLAAHFVGPRMLPVIRRHLYAIAAFSGVLMILYIIYTFYV